MSSETPTPSTTANTADGTQGAESATLGAQVDQIDQHALDEVALSRQEYQWIVELMGRAPNRLELGLFGAMWSEHCGYKNSRPLLKRFPSTGERVLLKVGEENAGAVDIGDGQAVVFKIESHNHPSAIEPYQGAATGVGGIVRDIFTMGARPIALLDSLRFGPLTSPRNRYLFHGIVGGVGGYGNCLGIPTVGGEIYFDESYSGNPLVNAMCVGLIESDKLIPAKAAGEGNPVLVVGAATGRDGIHGATFASVELDESSEERRPAVQVGDPFTEKLLMEACLELRDKGWIVGMQDLGAAGMTSSTVESAHKGGAGIDLDVLRAPRREAGMTPYDLMLSESQERMLVTAKKGHEDDVAALFARWGLRSAVVGHVVAEPVIRVREGEQVVAEIPTEYLTDKTPSYIRQGVQPQELRRLWTFDYATLRPNLPKPADALLRLIGSPDLCSREDVYRTYDTMVGTNTAIGPGSDAAVLRVPPAEDEPIGHSVTTGTEPGERLKLLAMTTDGNGRLTYLHSFNGGALAVAEAARNCVVTGARPLALTNCLNFGNPEKPGAYYQMERAIDGMAEAARILETPVISGNVSLYNESFGQGIFPTPVVGMVGLIEGRAPTPSAWGREGDVVALLGGWNAHSGDLGGSSYLATIHGTVAGHPPLLDLDRERAVQRLTLAGIERGLICSAHDCSDGGLAVALAECAIWSGLGLCGAETPLPGLAAGDADALATLAALYGEAPSRIVVSVAPEDYEALAALAAEYETPVARLGVVGGERLTFTSALDVVIDDLRVTWRDGLRVALGADDAEQVAETFAAD
ncbi:MAG TPA: phosphoribosylformylglycinamidine synthase subunit PurL [Ktedonobacterales bacterium]|nr:phosphoribosylformylglycinamidine synthase subunit PurL [Ktedonobacterales bacterium]